MNMMAAVLLACVVAVAGTEVVSYAPTKQAVERTGGLWEDMLLKRDSASEEALLSAFSPDARLCFNGRCGGRDSAKQFNNDYFRHFKMTFHDGMYLRNSFHTHFTGAVVLGRCSGQFEAVFSGYVNEAGQITELHEWYEQGTDKFLTSLCSDSGVAEEL
eukprot:TRINITY_DN35031_c0_g1_i1.p1 TRINITY_DN35031_c0_g1~~TRINITY_DN35031_c0_g1_i1.p1  ORF type:complete len:159 (+),score=59.51 TRINITY_DN35031_c0_g1_i1:45-521(+)